MNRNKILVIIGFLSAALALTFSVRKQASISHFVGLNSNSKPQALHLEPKSSPKSGSAPVQNLEVLNPWDYHKPLSTAEKQEFETAKVQIQKYITWGKMDPDSVPAFRQTLFKLGNRLVAELARELSQLSKDDIKDKADAEAVVHKIDELAYFSNSSNPLAGDSIAALAMRPVSWNDNGELQNPVGANITFEMFDIFAKLRPTEALTFITSIDKRHRTAYFTRYAYGRKLAGKTLDDIDSELKAVFGSAEVALK